jgi:hypothetical protein
MDMKLSLDNKRVFDDRALRSKFGPKKDEVTGRWRELQNEELRKLYSSPSEVKEEKDVLGM